VKIRGPRRWDDGHLGSHGLAEQVCLLVRVALSRYLCAGQESVPLVLDDVTVQADERRAERMLELLLGWARHRQVILFTKEEQVLAWARAHQHEPNLDLVEIEADQVGQAEQAVQPAMEPLPLSNLHARM
jgi:recombinational DNA repair ATPase RecF